MLILTRPVGKFLANGPFTYEFAEPPPSAATAVFTMVNKLLEVVITFPEVKTKALEAAFTFKAPFKVTEFEATILIVSEFKSLTLDGMNKPALAFV